jgi:hypothetical protein
MFTSKNKTSLKQGEQFKIMQQMFNKVVKNIGKNNYVGMEGAENMNANSKDTTKMENLIDEFRKTLQEYREAYSIHLIGATNDPKNLLQYYNNTIKGSGDEIFYITSRGIKRKLEVPPEGDWATTGQVGWKAVCQSHNCPLITPKNTVDDNILSKFEEGQPLKYKRRDNPDSAGNTHYFQKCPPPAGPAAWTEGGVFIETDGTAGGPLAWIDHKGKKYHFKDGLNKEEAHNSCPKRAPHRTHRVPAIEFNNLMEKSSDLLDKNSPCPGIIQTGVPNAAQLNNKLIDLAIEMKTEVNGISQRNQDTNKASSEVKRNLDTLIGEVTKHRKNIKELKKEIFSLDTTITDNTYLVKSINLRYIAWGISFITVFLIGMHQIKK